MTATSPSWHLVRRHFMLVTIIFLSSFPSLFRLAVGDGTVGDLENMFVQMELYTLDWAKHMESLVMPQNRCSLETIKSCSKSSYNGCISEMPYATCPGAENRILACGEGKEGGCSGLLDFTTTKVSLARGDIFDSIRNPSEREKDGVCYTLPADKYITEKRGSRDIIDYWNNFKVLPPSFYYGNDDGVFRIMPGSLEECASGSSTFDPRVRPWYVAASSGPKDVILILDTSGSMSNAGRLGIMKEAAARVVGTLGVSDFVSVIEFSSYANHIGTRSNDNYSLMQRASPDTKTKIINQIEDLDSGGGTNFKSGFDLAFQTFSNSISNEMSSGCHKAILFLTDGIMADDKNNLMSFITTELGKYDSSSANGSRPAIFTYSFGSGATSAVPKEIACANDGIWASIRDGGDLAKSMGAYYKYFAYGLSGADNSGFVAWVSPYKYSTTGELGTTSSAAVYDRSVDPPVLAGVVGLDFSIAAMEKALGEEGEASFDIVLKRIVDRSVATCPKLELTPCQLESLREYGSGDSANLDAMCNITVGSCDTNPLKPTLCRDLKVSSYPSEIWNNDNNKGRSYEEKACCTVGEEPRKANTISLDEVKGLVCVEKVEKSNEGMIIGIIVGSIVFGLVTFVGYRCYMRKGKDNPAYALPLENPKRVTKSVPTPTPVSAFAGGFDDVVVLPPPSAPNCNN